MAITGVGNYSSVYENTYALSRKETAKKEETEAKGGKAESPSFSDRVAEKSQNVSETGKAGAVSTKDMTMDDEK